MVLRQQEYPRHRREADALRGGAELAEGAEPRDGRNEGIDPASVHRVRDSV